jgi:small subunit ribosomal protein S21
MPQVTPKYNPKTRQSESFDGLLRRFKKACDNAGIIQEVRDREYYEKPNQVKHKKLQQQKRRNKLEAIKKSKESGRSRHPW